MSARDRGNESRPELFKGMTARRKRCSFQSEQNKTHQRHTWTASGMAQKRAFSKWPRHCYGKKNPTDRVFPRMTFSDYEVENSFDEMFRDNGQPRATARRLVRNIESLPPGELLNRQPAAERALLQIGITFNVCGENAGTDRIFPFNLVPRIVPADHFATASTHLLSMAA